MYLYEIDKAVKKKKLDFFIYDSAIEYIKISYLHGVIQSIKKNKYYKGLG
jgi:hypothetical protein